MNLHTDVKELADVAYTKHRISKSGPGLSWLIRDPDRSAYWFRVTWAPGFIMVGGDIGEITYTHYHAMPTLWDAVLWINGCDYDYLTGKSNARKEFDREATAAHVIEMIYGEARQWSGQSFFDHSEGDYYRWLKEIIERFNCGDIRDVNDRKDAIRTFIADTELTDRDFYELTHDCEVCSYSYPAQTRWQFEAVKLWAAEMLRSEPAWHRAWRWSQRQWAAYKRFRKNPPVWAPILYTADETLNGARYWRWKKHRWGGQYIAMRRWKPFGIDLSGFGFWQEQGSTWPDDHYDYKRWRPVEAWEALSCK